MEIIEDSYGSSTGPGPRHLLFRGASGPEALCGVKRIDVYRWSSWMTDERTCVRCLDRKRKAAAGAVADPLLPSEIGPVLDEAAAALSDLVYARARVAKQIGALRGAQSQRLDELLKLAHENGYTLAELGQILGRTRERIRQRIANLPPEVA